MNIVFLSEMGFEGKISSSHTNMRTEFAWMNALNAEHKNLNLYNDIRDYDHVSITYKKALIGGLMIIIL